MTDTTSMKHQTPLTSGDFTAADEPFALFEAWLSEAIKSEPNDPNAMALATVDADGLPDVRMVLMKGFDTDGFVFYSHIASQKGRELAANPKAALLFHWKSLRRQVRIRGNVTPVTRGRGRRLFRHPPEAGADRRLGEQAVASRSRAASPSSRRSPRSPPSTSSARCRVRRAGAAGASRRRVSSSGTTAHSACTTASNFAVTRPARHGPRRGCIPSILFDHDPLGKPLHALR